jgi:hypothetical protein
MTAIVATLAPRADGACLCWSNAGHPPPLLPADDRTTVLERRSDSLLGVDPGRGPTTSCCCAPRRRC